MPDALNILRVIILTAEDDHVLNSAADKELAVVNEAHVTGLEEAVVIRAVIYQARAELLQRQFRIVPITETLAIASDPDLADAAWLQSDMAFGVDNLDVEPCERRSATDNLRGSADFGDLRSHARLAECNGMLVDGNNFAAAERNRQRIFSQAVSSVEAFRLEAVGLEGFQESRVGVGLDWLGRDHQHMQRTEIAIFQTLFGNSSGAQAVFIRKVRRGRCGGAILCDRLEPEIWPLDKVGGSETVGRAATQRGIEIAADQSHVVILRKPGNDYGRRMIDDERAGLQNIFVGDHHTLRLHG